ncbi:MAG: hypothetical protein QXG03_12045 [Halalkalicoccus sp.]
MGDDDGDAFDDLGDADGDAWDDEPAGALAEEVIELFDDLDDPEAARAAMQRGEFEEAYAMMGLSAEEAEALAERWRERAERIIEGE